MDEFEVAWHWLLQQLTNATGQEVLKLGDSMWRCEDLLRLVESAAASSKNNNISLQKWCESLRLLNLGWYPVWQESGLSFSITFKALSQSANLTPLWWLLQIWYLSLSRIYPSLEWRLAWPQSQKTTIPLHFRLLPSHYAIHPTLHVGTKQQQNPQSHLNDILSKLLHHLSQQGSQPQGLLEQVKQQLTQALPTPPQLSELAALHRTPPRTLQRKFRTLGTSYNQLLEEVRRNNAISLLSVKHFTTQQVGQQLGYRDTPSFQRAFRKWFSMSPGQYRQQYYESTSRHDDELPAVSLYYAIRQERRKAPYHCDGARIWIALRNLSFVKSVTVVGEDKDGLWRPYSATFERALSKELELWSTSNLPVHAPFRFHIKYQVGGKTHIDNDRGHDYCLDGPVLLGSQPAVCHQLIRVVGAEGKNSVLVRLFSRDEWSRVNVVCHDNAPPLPLHGRQHSGAWEWQGIIDYPDTHLPLIFHFHQVGGAKLILDNNGVGYSPQCL
ncbi:MULTISPECIES: helix-turn-helix transcriptional regulator [unclassified Serratia (in: enterobacteria)]|uniref:helix-turn-helix transcriptional regulator n=1 Tax=unclassified Serratia (in: enterobacteria) TaxID=2647522 RepID=UPI00307644D0